jgi:hypothetical protein
VETVPAFLAELAARLVPACDPAVVAAVFARASDGYRGPRGRDGRRVTAISPSGVPFEASVTGGSGRSSSALRYVTETATGMPFFGPRLAAQRAALDDLVRWLPPAARGAARQLRDVVDVLFPDPAAIATRRRFATLFGIVHGPEVPDGIVRLKVYGNVRAGAPMNGRPDEHPSVAPLARLADRWPEVGALHALVCDVGFLEPHFTTVEVDAAGRVTRKLYLRTYRADAAGVAVLARRFGAEAGPVVDELRAAGVGDDVWRGRYFVCAATGPDGERELSVHLPSKALRLDPLGMDRLARRLVDRHGERAGLDALDAASERAGGRDVWPTTVIGVGLAGDGGLGKVNVYRAPVAADRR